MALKVLEALLINSSQTGLIDQLSNQGRLMAAGMIPSVNKDHGAHIFFFVPKIMGQSLSNAEKQVLGCIEIIKSGAFDETELTSIKNQLLLEKQQELEDITSRAILLGELFSKGQSSNQITKQIKDLQEISKKVVVDAANNYFGANYMVLHSKTGFPKKEKLNKPGFKPVIADQTTESEYARYFKTIREKKITPHFLDFRNDVSDQEIYTKHRLISAKNPQNSIFSLDVSFQTSVLTDPALVAAFNAMNYVETPTMTNTQIKQQLQQLGLNFYYEVSENEATISISGLESNLERAFQILRTLMQEGRFNDKVIPKIMEEKKAEYKLRITSPDYKAQLVGNYVLYGNSSPYLIEASIDDLKTIKPAELFQVFKNATQYEAEIKFVGNTPPEKLKFLIETNHIVSTEAKKQKQDFISERKEVNDNIVYVLPDSKSLQCQVNFLVTSPGVDNKDKYKMDAFNDYFGNSFSGLVLQEIREYRSLAYSAGAMYRRADNPGAFSWLKGTMGVQADKTNHAVAVFDSLLKFMPEKPERTESIRNNLINLATSSYPEFRKVPATYLAQRKLGYTQSAWMDDLPKYETLTFADITNFYKDHIQNRPQAIMLVGNTSRFNLKEFEKYGKIVKLSEKVVMRK
jgi:predicted Zn-dependent peptidase